MLSASLPAAAASTEPSVPADVVGWVLFVTLLLLFVGIYVWSIRRTRRRRGADRERAAQDALTAHHTVRWDADPATFTAEARHWPLAVGAIFTICAGTPWDRLAGASPDQAREGLAEAWGIRSRAQLLAQLHSLLTSGHRSAFAAEQVAWAGVSQAEAVEIEQSLTSSAADSQEVAEALWRFRRMRANDRSIQSVNFAAWDLVRFIMLTRAGYALGFLTQEEAEDFLLLPSSELQARYVGWAELGDQFRMARWYWHSTGGQAEAEQDRHDTNRQQALLAPGSGPWSHVPWQLPLPPSRMLLADALLAEDLIEPLSPEVREDVGFWAFTIDNAVRERLGLPGQP